MTKPGAGRSARLSLKEAEPAEKLARVPLLVAVLALCGNALAPAISNLTQRDPPLVVNCLDEQVKVMTIYDKNPTALLVLPMSHPIEQQCGINSVIMRLQAQTPAPAAR